MNMRDDDQVSAVALVVESEAQTAAQVIGDDLPEPVDAAAPRSRPAATSPRPRTRARADDE